jgi:hypothetical protein
MPRNLAMDFLQGASNAAASTVSGPVDLLAFALRKAGFPVPEDPVLGAKWMADRGITVQPQNQVAGMLGETAGMVVPIAAAAKAPQIAAGMLQAGQNLVTPRQAGLIADQRGMLNIGGRGKVPETRADVNTLADRFGRLLDDAGVQYNHDKSSLSPARYFKIDNPRLPDENLTVRISDHRDMRGGNTFSVDPTAATTFEEMLSGLRDAGVNVANRAKPLVKRQMDDATIEKIYGLKISDMKTRGMDVESIRAMYLWDNKRGHWVQKP